MPPPLAFIPEQPDFLATRGSLALALRTPSGERAVTPDTTRREEALVATGEANSI
ncbi:hypothetical protein Pmar_PMAR023590 [Perkinsus marinus ATCC 50983]|uniref:Uncharacterized protein n=1 Tax=Perkinsus marinus (strain ATCC 50983 / TXsc) TaxID=423536 RepID=C5KCS0_PERM5|nr:hypothetical protein Pmar_PMAR023590 [Perkinsus marinus ATCC 50983]EER17669.1 hypothetical protein Pmar_PMAR023590 [Perkinsus marinus ATCC 50983]|eukprot:XP_002785873.1 hypothetical protein Pmar_PMAR023590 [Perkinsus marinus ATCC 50983]